MEKKYIFICGLHRSGTSILQKILGSSTMISKHTNTMQPEDEGQHIQTVYKPAKYFGGPGAFANNPSYHLTNTSTLLNDTNNKLIINQWNKYWDLSKPILLEKSPPNIIHTRYLQELVKASYFIVIIRHPVVVAMATMKWNRQSIELHIKHWLKAYTIFYNDKSFLKKCKIVKYESLNNPNIIEEFALFLDEEASKLNITMDKFVNSDHKYFNKYKPNKCIIDKYELEINKYGYSFLPPYYI
jgi:hypothetical protein